MRIRQLGESCLIMKELPCPPAELAHILNQSPPPGLLEAVPAFDQLAIYFEPDTNAAQTTIQLLSEYADQPSPQAWGGTKGGVDESTHSVSDSPVPKSNLVRHSDESQNPPESKTNNLSLHPEESRNEPQGSEAKPGQTPSPSLGRGRGGVDESSLSVSDSPLPKPGPAKAGGNDEDINKSSTHHKIPALYSGPDLVESAQTLNLTVEQLIDIHSQATYTVEAIGFCPGFPYLSGLPPELQNLPRRPTPRTKVEPGTIAITGDQCCVYPLERPGGWNLIALTPFTIVNPETDYFPLQVGDTIQFQPIDETLFNQLVGQHL